MFFQKNKPTSLSDIQFPIELNSKLMRGFLVIFIAFFSFQLYLDPRFFKGLLEFESIFIVLWFGLFIVGSFFSFFSYLQTFTLDKKTLTVSFLGQESTYQLKDIEQLSLGYQSQFFKKEVFSLVIHFQCGKKIKLQRLQSNYPAALLYLESIVPQEKKKDASAFWQQWVF